MKPRHERLQQGFTLIELLIVLVILAIVSSIVLVALMNALDRAKQRATMSDMRTISKGLEAYSVDHGYLPSDGGGMTTLQAVLIPYQTSVVPVKDAWGHPYSYTRDALGNYSLECFGKDGEDGPQINFTTRNSYDRDILIVNGQFVASPE